MSKLTITTETSQDELQNFNDFKEIESALQPYINAAKTGKGDLIRSAFFDHAHIVGSIAGEFHNMDANEFQDTVNKGGESVDVKYHIAWIDISGPAAAAKVEFINWLGLRFTDFFVLYKKEGIWKISGKVFDSHSNN